MKENLNNEQLFDNLFKESLENVSNPVPDGIWQSVSSSVGSSAATGAGLAAKTAVWMKAAIAAAVIGTGTLISYNYFSDKDEAGKLQPSVVAPVQENTENPVPDALTSGEISNNAPVSNEAAEFKAPATEKAGSGKPVEDGIVCKPLETPSFMLNRDAVNKTIEELKRSSQDANQEESPVSSQIPDKLDNKENVASEQEGTTVIVDSSLAVFPDAVTPNADGINDEFLIKMVGEESVLIQIFDLSMKNKLFETRNKYKGWNCTLPNGEEAPEGKYLVRIVYKMKGKETQTKNYTLTILK